MQKIGQFLQWTAHFFLSLAKLFGLSIQYNCSRSKKIRPLLPLFHKISSRQVCYVSSCVLPFWLCSTSSGAHFPWRGHGRVATVRKNSHRRSRNLSTVVWMSTGRIHCLEVVDWHDRMDQRQTSARISRLCNWKPRNYLRLVWKDVQINYFSVKHPFYFHRCDERSKSCDGCCCAFNCYLRQYERSKGH